MPYLMDLLVGFDTGACLHLLEMDDLEAQPSRKQEVFDILPPEKYKFIKQIAKDILEKCINLNLSEMLVRKYLFDCTSPE